MKKRKLRRRVAREGWLRTLPVKEGWATQNSAEMTCCPNRESRASNRNVLLKSKKNKKNCIDEKTVSGEEHTIK